MRVERVPRNSSHRCADIEELARSPQTRLRERPCIPASLIPVPVTGIQPDQVLGLKRLTRAADAALLDPCDEHRDEGGADAVPRNSSHRCADIKEMARSPQTRLRQRPCIPASLIPVLVTRIQPGQVLGLKRLTRAADAALLDPCDEHRDEIP